METVKGHMDRLGVSVLFVHHNRKMRDDDDPFNMISGTNGIMGAADTIWTITKSKLADAEAVLHITGRDVEQSDTVITFDKKSWTMLSVTRKSRYLIMTGLYTPQQKRMALAARSIISGSRAWKNLRNSQRMGKKKYRMNYYKICPYCGAHLDPGERCDCRENEDPPPASAANAGGGRVEQSFSDTDSTSHDTRETEDLQV